MWFNPLMEWLLKSPLHGLISGNTMIIYYTGCKTGKACHVPVNYLRLDNQLLSVSFKKGKWWRNFRNGAGVNVLLKGKLVSAHAQAVEDDAGVAEGFKTIIKLNPRLAGSFWFSRVITSRPSVDLSYRARCWKCAWSLASRSLSSPAHRW